MIQQLHRGMLGTVLALACLCVLFATPNALRAQDFVIEDIRVDGLQRIAAGTVFNYLPVQIGDRVRSDVTARVIRSLYATGFFDDVSVEQDGNVLIVSVRERPAIAEINLVGNKSLKTEVLKEGLAEIGLAEGRVFDRSVLDRIELELRRQYFASGKYGVEVESTVSPLERNRVAVRIQVNEGKTARLKQINIVGNEAFSEKQLLKEFELGKTNWLSFYTKNDRYAKPKLAGDLETLRSFYLDRGFIEFRITSTQVTISPDKQDIYVTIAIEEGDVYRIADLRLAGDPPVPPEDLFPLIQMSRGEVFSRKAATESSDRISNLLGSEGFAFANVNAIPEVNEEDKTVSLTFFVDPGKRVYVRRITLEGNTRTRDEVLRREMRQLEAAWFSTELVQRSRQRLQRLGYFEEVNIETPAVPGTADQVDVRVKVKEKPSGNLMAGVGFSQSEGILFNTSISQENFLGTGKRVSFAFNTSKTDQLYRLAYTNPYYTIDGISRGFDLSYRTTDFDALLGADYSTDAGRADVNFGLPISDNSRFGLGFYYQYTHFKAGPNSELAQQFVKDSGDKFNDFFLTASFNRDTRDSALFPSSGGLHSIFGEFAVPSSDLEYYRVNYRTRQYLPLNRALTLSFKADLGYGGGYGKTSSLPFFENFYAGGPGSVRGFEANTLGPRETTGDLEPVGGNAKLTGGFELSAPPPVGKFENTLRVGAFFDFGNVWWTESNTLVSPTGIDLSDLRYSTGLSASWLSPVGALQLSVGFPLNQKDGDEKQVFQFTFGQNF